MANDDILVINVSACEWLRFEKTDKFFTPARANSEGTFPRLRKNIYTKSSTATISKTKDKKHYKLENWKSDFDLVDQQTQFEVDIPLGPEN